MKSTIRNKTIILLLIIGLLPMGVITLFTMNRVSAELLKINEDRLISLREEKKLQIEHYFKQIEGQSQTFANNEMVVNAMRLFNQAFKTVPQETVGLYGEAQVNRLRERYVYQRKNTPGAANDAADIWFPQKRTTQILQSLYISENPNPVGAKEALDHAGDSSTYSQIHQRFHPAIRNYLEKFGYYDIFLVEPETGYIVYSVFKEVDYATSLVSGPYSQTGIGRAYQTALNAQPGTVVMDDFASYAPSYNAAAAFIATPIYNGAQLLGVLIFQAPVDRIDAVMTSNKSWKDVGLGDSGEVYLVGQDFKLRNNSRFLIENPKDYFAALESLNVDKAILNKSKSLKTSIGMNEIRTLGTENAVAGKTGFQIISDYRGVPVLSAYSAVNILGHSWGILAEIDEAEVFAVQSSLRNWILFSVAIIIAVLIGVSMVIGGWFSRPILALVERAQLIARGDLKQEPMIINSKDEIGELGNSFNTMMDAFQLFIGKMEEISSGQFEKEEYNFQGDLKTSIQNALNQANEKKRMEQDERKNIEREQQQAVELQEKVNSMLEVVQAAAEGDLTREVTIEGSDTIGQMGEGLKEFLTKLRRDIHSIGENVKTLATTSIQMSTASQTMAGNAEETSAQANVVASASEQVTSNINTVATGSEEMSASIKEIAKSSSEAAKVASKAVKAAEQTNATIKQLADSSEEIGEVIKVITSIAEQTNLLALNATIEAARAGEAGKGFAVVANEVKELATQTGKATEDIDKRIESIQADTEGAVSAMDEIGKVINQINDISSTIASAVEEQTATTNEIARNVNEAAKGTQEISVNISGVAQAALSTTHGSQETQTASGELSKMASELKNLVSQFKC